MRKKPFTPRQHIRVLRLAMIGVAFFAFVFGALFRQTEFIFMWWGVTQALYVGGAGAAIIGGLYWKRGTVGGAWTAMMTGSTLATAGILARQFSHGTFPLNGAQISFGATMIAGTTYIVVSLLTCREGFNMDRMLHRGAYAGVKALVGDRVLTPGVWHQPGLGRWIGFDSEYTPGDKWIAGGLFGWSVSCMGMAIIGTVWNLVSPWPPAVWSAFWHVVGIGIPVGFTVVTGCWFTWGGLRDIGALFRRMRLSAVNERDDGSVLGHLNLDEAAAVEGEAVLTTSRREPDEQCAH